MIYEVPAFRQPALMMPTAKLHSNLFIGFRYTRYLGGLNESRAITVRIGFIKIETFAKRGVVYTIYCIGIERHMLQ